MALLIKLLAPALQTLDARPAACEAPRHPLSAMSPAVRAGLLETARRLDPLVLRWGR